ncbi:hypothetical protein BSL78_09810 [Apostichopus japonicus]|uniref:CCHC-type domain-containing protein n=1 Tax=Stichopus japonicus TaxID=307972 RepID=A0A2G8KZ82_STIJA|nr:hypothetical protein BSL78_09810 [Apostichopus japonicus]
MSFCTIGALVLSSPGEPPTLWPQWKRMFSNYMLAAGTDTSSAGRKQAILLHSLGLEGQRIFYTLPDLPVVEGEDVYDRTIRVLEKRFEPTVNVVAARYRFRKRSQLTGEPVDTYMSALRELSSTCNFGTFLDEMLRDQLVEKTNSTRIRERLLLETDLKLSKAIETARRVEQAVRDSRSISGKMPEEATCANVKFTKGKNSDRPNHRSGDARNSQSQFTKSRGNSSFTNQNTPDNRGRQCCYRCGSKQHLAKSHLCRAKNAKCDACGKTGHFARICLQNNNNASVRKVDSTQSSTLHNPSTTDEGTDSVQVLGISNVTGPAVEAGSAKPSIVCDLEINSISLRFVVDTGSDITLMNARRFDKYFLRESLGPINKKLVSYNNTVIQTLGCFTANVGHKGKSMHANIYVVEVGISLIGKDVIQGLGLQLDGKSLSCLQVGTSDVGPKPMPSVPGVMRGSKGYKPNTCPDTSSDQHWY